MKDASELYLATDEDREGEAISWHLLEYLKPKSPGQADGVPRDHQGRHRPRREQPPRHRLRARRRRRDPPHPRPAVRLRGLAGAVAARQPGSVGRSGAEPVDPPDRRARARAHRVRVSAGYWDIELAHRDGSVVHRHARRRRRRARSPPARTSTPTACCEMPAQGRRCSTRRGPERSPTASPTRRSRCARVEEQPYPVVAEGAVHDLDPAAGGRSQAAAVGVAGDASRTGSVRARLHHLHAYRQRHAVAPRP